LPDLAFFRTLALPHAQVQVYVTIVSLPLGQLGAKGIAICFRVDEGVLAEELPRPPSQSGTLVVRLPARPTSAEAEEAGVEAAGPVPPLPREFTVNYGRIFEALDWLHLHNPLFRGIQRRQPSAEELAAAAEHEAAAELVPVAEELQVDHAGAAMPSDPALQVGALQAELSAGNTTARGLRRQEGTLHFTLQRSTGRPLSILTERALEVCERCPWCCL
jgi:hypothetical protein